MNEKISVIIPFYNAEKYLNQCIESVLCQTYPYLEIILVNDGSTDHSLHICQKYIKSDSRITIINQPNRGVSSARNSGIEKASGMWVSFIDADDWLDSSAFEWAIRAQKIYNTDLVLWNRIDEFPSKSIVRSYADDKIVVSDETGYEDFKFRIFTGHNAQGQRDYGPQNIIAKIIKKSLLDNIRFDENLKHHEDIFFMLEVYEKAKSLYLENQHFYHRRMHSDSAIHRFYPEICENNKLISQKYSSFLESNKKSQKYYDFWKGLHVNWLLQIFSLYLFHPDNTMPFQEKIKKIQILLNSEPYTGVFKNTPSNIILPKKIFFEIAKHRFIILLLMYSKLYARFRPD